MSERHHLVPRFYLHGWHTAGEGLTAVRRGTGEVLTRNAKTVAVETDAYAIDVPKQDKSYAFEKLLSQVESGAALALRNMLDSWPPNQRDRESWSLLTALQITRGRNFRDNVNAVQEHMLKMMISLDSRDPESMKKRLEGAGLEASESNLALLREMMDRPDTYKVEMHPAHVLRLALDLGIQLVPYLAGRRWTLVTLSEPWLVTTDHPLTLHSESTSLGPFGGVGVATADEVWMPLHPTRLLIMTHPGQDPRGPTTGNMSRVNISIAKDCTE